MDVSGSRVVLTYDSEILQAKQERNGPSGGEAFLDP